MKLVTREQNHAVFDFGELTVIALRDGYVDMPPTRLRQTSGKAFNDLPKEVPLVGGKLRLSVNTFLVIGDGQSVLIDTGASNTWDPSMGMLLNALQEAGIDRNDITDVAVTHTHGDHVSGLIAPDGSEAFPHARGIYVPREEMSAIRGRLAKLRERVTPIDDGFRISNRITAVRAAGHSSGHTAYKIESSKGVLFAWGDIVHVPSLQFGRPEITWELDGDQAKARQARLQLLERVAQPDSFVAGAHLEFPGIGKVTRKGQAFELDALV